MFQGVFPLQVRQHLLDADGLGGRGTGAFEKPLSRLVQEPVFDHPVDAPVDAVVKEIAVFRREADVDDIVVAGFPAGLGDLVGHSVPCQFINFKGSKDSSRIVRVEAFRVFGVDALQPGVHRLRTRGLEFPSETGADLGVVPRVEELQVLDERIEVQAGAADEDDVLPSPADVRDDAGRVLLEPRDTVVLGRVHDIDEVVRDALHLVRRRFRGGHVHALVELHGVEREDLSVQCLCQFHGQRRFPGRGGADDRHQRCALSV